jgi:hypothetical protein
VAQHQGDFEKAEKYALDGLAQLHELDLEYHTAITFSMLSGPLAAQGKAHEAAVLLGATESIYKRLSIQLQPADQVEVDAYVLSVRDILGDSAFESAFEEGRKMQLEEAVSFALNRRQKTK